jgi:hypothetical protein
VKQPKHKRYDVVAEWKKRRQAGGQPHWIEGTDTLDNIGGVVRGINRQERPKSDPDSNDDETPPQR